MRKIRFLRTGVDYPILLAVLFLMILSIVMVASASIGEIANTGNAVWLNFIKQLVYFLVGMIILLWCLKNFEMVEFICRRQSLAVIMTGLLMVTLLFPEINGAKAWIQLGFFSFQPAELVKVFVILYSAWFFPRFNNVKESGFDVILKPGLVLLFWVGFIILVQGDTGSALIILVIASVGLLVIDGKTFWGLQLRMRQLYQIGFGMLLIILSPIGRWLLNLINTDNYMILRFKAVLDPFFDIYGNTMQLYNSLLAFARGGIFGVTVGKSVQKFGYLPAARTDFIFPIIVEEWGLLGILLVMVPYCLIVYRLFNYALKIKDRPTKIILLGTTIYFVVHFILNVGGASALLPLTGVPLLLVSSGGSSTLSILLLMGICLNQIAKYRQGLIQ